MHLQVVILSTLISIVFTQNFRHFGQTPINLGCDFEEDEFCGWSQSKADEFNWRRNNGSTLTPRTGPTADHTLGPSGNGHYIYIETSTGRYGDSAHLVSPIYPPSLKDMCFEFWYHMRGPDRQDAVGSLTVYILPDSATVDDIDPSFSITGNQEDTWHRAFIPIPMQEEDFKLVVIGTKKGSPYSDIAVDDLKITPCTEGSTVTWHKPMEMAPEIVNPDVKGATSGCEGSSYVISSITCVLTISTLHSTAYLMDVSSLP